MVRVKCAVYVPKGKNKFSKPVKVEKIYGNAARVQGGHWWKCAKLIKVTGKRTTTEYIVKVNTMEEIRQRN